MQKKNIALNRLKTHTNEGPAGMTFIRGAAFIPLGHKLSAAGNALHLLDANSTVSGKPPVEQAKEAKAPETSQKFEGVTSFKLASDHLFQSKRIFGWEPVEWSPHNQAILVSSANLLQGVKVLGKLADFQVTVHMDEEMKRTVYVTDRQIGLLSHFLEQMFAEFSLLKYNHGSSVPAIIYIQDEGDKLTFNVCLTKTKSTQMNKGSAIAGLVGEDHDIHLMLGGAQSPKGINSIPIGAEHKGFDFGMTSVKRSAHSPREAPFEAASFAIPIKQKNVLPTATEQVLKSTGLQALIDWAFVK